MWAVYDVSRIAIGRFFRLGEMQIKGSKGQRVIHIIRANSGSRPAITLTFLTFPRFLSLDVFCTKLFVMSPAVRRSREVTVSKVRMTCHFLSFSAPRTPERRGSNLSNTLSSRKYSRISGLVGRERIACLVSVLRLSGLNVCKLDFTHVQGHSRVLTPADFFIDYHQRAVFSLHSRGQNQQGNSYIYGSILFQEDKSHQWMG